MTTVGRWTGREAKLLREALRLSVRDFIGTAEFAAQQGHAWYLLSATQPDAAARAVPLLTAATGALGSDYARTRAVNLAGLAGSHARAGDIDAAVSVGRHALEEISRTSSRRAR